MNKQEDLLELQRSFESLKYFILEYNNLILNYNGIFKMPLNHIILKSINSNLFKLDPPEIFQVIYMLELLYKTTLTEEEINFIIQYTNNYLILNDSVLEGNKALQTKVWCLGIPINLAYDQNFVNLQAALIIDKLNANHSQNLENGYNKGQKLELINKKIPIIHDEEKNYAQVLGNTGFVSLLLLISGIVATVAYVTYFIIS